MNIDKGNQESGGTDMVTIGDTGNGTENFQYVLVEKNNNDQAFEITADEDGKVWVIIGTDSAFESTTTLFYDRVHLIFTTKS